jgi:hypothetical protein
MLSLASYYTALHDAGISKDDSLEDFASKCIGAHREFRMRNNFPTTKRSEGQSALMSPNNPLPELLNSLESGLGNDYLNAVQRENGVGRSARQKD